VSFLREQGTLGPVLLFVTLALIALQPFVAADGTPAFFHDWNWPLTAHGVRTLVVDLSAARTTGNWGAASWVTRASLLQPILLVASFLFAPALLIKIMLASIFAAAGWGAYRFCRALGGEVPAAMVGGMWYLAAPVAVDEAIAGHLLLLIGYAAFPHVLEAVALRRHWAVQTLLVGLSSMDVHFLGFDILGFALVALARRRFERTAWLALLTFAPSVATALFAEASGGLIAQRALPLYDIANSAQLADAVRGVGYFAGYDLPGRTLAVNIALWLAPACALVTLVRRHFLPAAFLAFGALLSAGVHSGLWPLLGPLFDQVPAASVYREFFDFTVLTALGGALAIALAPQRWATTAVVLIALVALAPQLGGAYAEYVTPYRPAEATLASLASIEGAPGSDLVLALPAQQPLGPAGYRGGLDPLGTHIGSHGTINSTYGLTAAARAVLVRSDGTAARLREQWRIGAVLERPGWTSRVLETLESGFKPGLHDPRPSPEGTWTVRRTRVSPLVEVVSEEICARGDFARLPAASGVDFAQTDKRCGGQGLVAHPASRPYPRSGWVLYDPMWFIAPWAASTLPGALFTTAQGVALPSPERCAPTVTYVYAGLQRVRGMETRLQQRIMNCRIPLTEGPTVVSGVYELGSREYKSVLVSSRVDRWMERPSSIWVEGTMHGDGVLRVRTAYSFFWFAWSRGSVRVKRHIVVDGAFNGWEASGSGPFAVTFIYVPGVISTLLEIAVWCLYLFAMVSLISKVGRSGQSSEAARLFAK